MAVKSSALRVDLSLPPQEDSWWSFLLDWAYIRAGRDISKRVVPVLVFADFIVKLQKFEETDTATNSKDGCNTSQVATKKYKSINNNNGFVHYANSNSSNYFFLRQILWICFR
jgi:hypothetical protein